MLNNIENIQKQGQENFENTVKSVNAVTKGFQKIAQETTDYSKKHLENSSAAVEQLIAAKSVEKAVNVQADYAKAAYQSYVEQLTRLGVHYANIAKEAVKPFEGVLPKSDK
jgi:hypothetical protein